MFRKMDSVELRVPDDLFLSRCNQLGITDFTGLWPTIPEDAAIEYCLGASGVSKTTGIRSLHLLRTRFSSGFFRTRVEVRLTGQVVFVTFCSHFRRSERTHQRRQCISKSAARVTHSTPPATKTTRLFAVYVRRCNRALHD